MLSEELDIITADERCQSESGCEGGVRVSIDRVRYIYLVVEVDRIAPKALSGLDMHAETRNDTYPVKLRHLWVLLRNISSDVVEVNIVPVELRGL